MAHYIKCYGATKQEAEEKARQEIKNMDFMRQPSLYAVQWEEPIDDATEGKWVAIVKYWGVD